MSKIIMMRVNMRKVHQFQKL